MTLKSKNRKVQLEFFFKEILKKSKKLLEAFFYFSVHFRICHVFSRMPCFAVYISLYLYFISMSDYSVGTF